MFQPFQAMIQVSREKTARIEEVRCFANRLEALAWVAERAVEFQTRNPFKFLSTIRRMDREVGDITFAMDVTMLNGTQYRLRVKDWRTVEEEQGIA